MATVGAAIVYCLLGPPASLLAASPPKPTDEQAKLEPLTLEEQGELLKQSRSVIILQRDYLRLEREQRQALEQLVAEHKRALEQQASLIERSIAVYNQRLTALREQYGAGPDIILNDALEWEHRLQETAPPAEPEQPPSEEQASEQPEEAADGVPSPD